ncbi:MAG: glycine--tRNA ligase subunit beta, partial [Gammaproteobacteria bacterium]
RRMVERRGPSLRAAYDDDGKPTRAAAGFATSCGVDLAQLERIETDKGAWLVCRQSRAGRKLAPILTECLAHILRRLPAPKRMRWGDGEVEFVRPAHWLLALHGARVVAAEALGLRAGRHTRGHRFHANRKLAVTAADAYEMLLEKEGMVIADFARRRAKIESQLGVIARKHGARKHGARNPGARVVTDAALLNMVTGMVEWPQALPGEFDARYLKLPPEALVSVMRDHQKYFPLAADDGKLLPAFIAVANIKSKSPKSVRRGNERVLRARLADAEFFLANDLKVTPDARREQLHGILFHQKLGTLHDKCARVLPLAIAIARGLHADLEKTKRAAQLCKADLASEMVGEFPELQGVIGRYCAQHHGEEKAVADAIEQHYLPRHAGDKLPRDAIAQSIALADRLDSLAGLFSAGEIPSGDKDPFALRRAALGVLRIIIEMQLDIDVYELLEIHAAGNAAGPGAQGVDQLFDFMQDRLKSYYHSMGYRADEVASVLACRPHKPLDFDRRLKALSRFFKKQPAAAESLAAANKRIANILRKSDDAPQNYERALLRENAERHLAAQLGEVTTHVEDCFARNQYDAGLVALSKLKQPIDAFFDEVMVMEKDAAIRNNRLALLHRIRALFLAIADISFMRTERAEAA